MFDTPPDLGCGQNPLAAFQDTLKNIVKVMMILYVVIFGLRIVMGGALPKKSEFFIFILKFALVMHFAVGSVPTANQKTGIDQVYELALTAMSSFSNMIAGNDDLGLDNNGMPRMGSNLCQYNIGGYKEGYEYLALWDSLDCKLAYYLSIASPLKGGGLEAVRGQFIHIGLFVLIWGAAFSFSLPLVIFLFAFGILLLSIIVYVAHVYIIALIAISITIFVGPIFIPMALFEKTKGYFDEWLKLLISYTLYPTIIVAFVGIMITTFDQTIYPDCEFTLTPYSGISYWEFATTQSDTCKDSYGYMMSILTSGSASEVIDFAGGLFQFSRLKSGNYMLEKLLSSLMMATFFAFLFYYFAKQLSAFAADVSQSTNIGGLAIKPTAIADVAIKIATKGKGKGAAKGKGKDKGKGEGIGVAGGSEGKSKRSGINVSGK
jgi:type IV secretion system protein VirB6